MLTGALVKQGDCWSPFFGQNIGIVYGSIEVEFLELTEQVS